MTLKENLSRLNTDVQKCYYDKDAGLFSHTLPKYISEMKSLLQNVVNKYPDLEEQTEKNHYWLLDQELQSIQSLIDKGEDADDLERDRTLNQTKRNLSEVRWFFQQEIWKYGVHILDEQF